MFLENYIIQILNSNKFVFETKFNTHIHVYLRARDVCVTPHLILFFKNLETKIVLLYTRPRFPIEQILETHTRFYCKIFHTDIKFTQ